ncbi:signal recognition particle-docking protein FtsY [Hoyosella sp. YIM 151337]|uniref:signal recognition particle-docking protein FtsY n=1 Tax=Hoyosella sp. YIM 151337 TaxID=2992742 RepID=UPI0022354FC2|nr:signal recognition particle-docking protein FtsY [Hoyosella sp. YIM 151337]MCW4353958.1 signal recognition particle-docking protein FtsY [Hoyosella sp. YIM 151337]
MTTELWIVVAVVAALILIALVAGAILYRRRQITLTKPPEVEKDKSGGYQAAGGFSFAQGPSGSTALKPPPETPAEPPRDTTPPTIERTDTEGQPHVGDDAAIPRDAPKRPIRDVPIPEAPTPRVTAEPSVVEEAEPVAPEAPAEAEAEPVAPEVPVEREPETVPPETAATAEAPAPVEAVPEIEEIAPTEGRLNRLRGRLSRSQNAVGKSLLGLLGGGDLDEDSWEEVEDTLLIADLGAATTTAIVDRLREEMASRTVRNEEQARGVLKDVLVAALRPDLDRSIRVLPHGDRPSVALVVGVNGTGKTTTTGKLARVLVADGRRVLLGAADTFRAAAADQLQTWAERVGAEVVRGREGADPASVAFDAVSRGIETGVDCVLIDTAGRLHTKTGLMDELGKVKRVVEKKAPVDEVLLVLDATIGQNGLAQARVFAEVVDITGVVLTKLDGTAKGGIVFQVQHELGVPVKLVGLGEGADHLAPFEPGAFVDALL